MSKHSSQLSSHPLLSTRRRLPDVSLVPEEVCLHGALSWHRPRLPPSRMSIPNHSTWHTNKRHTQQAVASELPRGSNTHITPETLHMAAVGLILYGTRSCANSGYC